MTDKNWIWEGREILNKCIRTDLELNSVSLRPPLSSEDFLWMTLLRNAVSQHSLVQTIITIYKLMIITQYSRNFLDHATIAATIEKYLSVSAEESWVTKQARLMTRQTRIIITRT